MVPWTGGADQHPEAMKSWILPCVTFFGLLSTAAISTGVVYGMQVLLGILVAAMGVLLVKGLASQHHH